MPDILYTATIALPSRPTAYLPAGYHLGRYPEISYHFYNVSDDPDALLRIEAAKNRIQHDHPEAKPIPQAEAQDLIDLILLGLSSDAKRPEPDGKAATAIVNDAIAKGEIAFGIRRYFDDPVLPFRASPLAGKTLLEIARSPAAVTIFVIWVARENAPVALLLTPFGIVAITVAQKSAPRIARAIDVRLKRWLK